MAPRLQWVGVALLAALTLLGALPSVAALSRADTSAAEPAPATGLPPAVLTGSAPPTHAPPLTCPTGYPAYGPLAGNVWPLDPSFLYQGSCHFVAVDEVHASFASGTAGSAERWSIPWTLPTQGPAGQQNVEEGLYLGMVVGGDPSSLWNQSFLEVLATPSLNGTGALVWGVNLSVLSLANSTSFSPAGCPLYALNLSWNNTYYCEFDDLPGGNAIGLLSGLVGGQAMRVTFDGNVSGTGGLRVYVNATGGAGSTATTLNATTTGHYTFEPAYSTACASGCFLRWGQSYGLGVGVDICPWFGTAFATCDSYNGTAYPSLPPVTWGIPEFWNVSAYTGDYHYLQPLSASGVCDTNPPGGQFVAGCEEFSSGGGDGFYPRFSLTGSGLDFGTTYPGSVTSFGGPYQQFLDVSGTQDLLPFVETGLVDSSLAGYLPPNSSLNVSVNVTDLGTIATVTLASSVNGSAWSTVDMTGTGNASAGVYRGIVPVGPDGPILYQVNATNGVGALVSSPVRTVLRGPLPTFTLGVGIDPGACGTVDVGGTSYPNGSSLAIGPGPVSVAASGCYPYNFTGWQTTAGLSASPADARLAELTVGASGNLTALFSYARPTDRVAILVAPVGCGEVLIDGTAYLNGTVAGVSFGLSHVLAATALCSGYAFGGWTPSANLTVLGASLVADDNGSLAATFVPTSTNVPVTFYTHPTACGGVGWGGAGYTNGESVYVAPGTYPLTPEPCRHYGFENFTSYGSGGGVSVAGTSMSVTGAGGVVENNFALTEVYVQTNPTTCGGVLLNGTSYPNGVYVAVENHSVYTATAFSCMGHYLDAFSASGALTLSGSFLTVNGSGTLLAVSLAGTPTIFVDFVTEPGNCGAVDLGGTSYPNGAFATFSPGTVDSIAALPCANYGVVGWSVSGLITIVGGEVWLNGSGAITAVFGALVPILIDTVPADCGAVVIGGVPFSNGGTATLVEGRSYSIDGTPCAHYTLEEFESSPYVQIANDSIAPNGPSTVTAVFVPIVYTLHLLVTGVGCGTVYLAGAPLGAGASVGLVAGNYTLGATPCSTSSFGGFTTTGGLSLAGGRLFVNDSGNLSATFVPILPALTLGGSAAAFVGGPAFFYASVAVPVAPTGYSYLWSFGDGASNTTSANTTTHVYDRTGTFTVTVEVIDPYHRSANASITVEVVARSAANYAGVLETGALAAGLAVGALALVWLLGRRRSPPPPRSEPSGAAPAARAEPAPPPPT